MSDSLSHIEFKQKVHQHYSILVQDKIDVFRDMIAGLSDDARNDAKGSAGDKHETTLSMMHLEQEKLNHKLREYLEQKAILDRIDAAVPGARISIGSLVRANGMWLFIAAALPKIVVEGTTVIAVSPQSPLGSKLVGQEVGYGFERDSKFWTVEIVL